MSAGLVAAPPAIARRDAADLAAHRWVAAAIGVSIWLLPVLRPGLGPVRPADFVILGATALAVLWLGWSRVPIQMPFVASMILFGIAGLVAALASGLSRELARADRALDERTRDFGRLRDLHELTVQSLGSGLLTVDFDGIIRSYNREAEHITGVPVAEALGKPLSNILAGAERLLDHERAELEAAFGPAFDTYGCREVMLIGSECDHHDGLHTSMENMIVELVVREADGTTRPARVGEQVALGDADARLVRAEVVAAEELHRVRSDQRQREFAAQARRGGDESVVVGAAGALHFEVIAARK